jgi:hypothetical protein
MPGVRVQREPPARTASLLVENEIGSGQRLRLLDTAFSEPCLFSLRKEVIQPQVLLRLPCYDFTPIMSHTLGLCEDF